MPVYQQSSFIENCWLSTDVKCLCRKKNYKKVFLCNQFNVLQTLTIFAKKASSKKNSCGYKTAIAQPSSFIENS